MHEGAVMTTVLLISSVAMVIVWSVAAFALAGAVGKVFARSDKGDPWYAVSRTAHSVRLVQTARPLDDELPARRTVTY